MDGIIESSPPFAVLRFPTWDTSLIAYCVLCVSLAEATQPLLLVLCKKKRAVSAFVCYEFQLSASVLLVALELCAVSTSFWQRNNTLSASRDRYFCSTNEPRFIDSGFKEMR